MKEIITKRSKITFYEKSYASFGYKIKSKEKYGTNFVLKLEQTSDENQDELQILESRLRIIELEERKKCGFERLFVNLSIHIFLFCLQAFILYHLNMDGAHPKIMLEVGILIFMGVLLMGFVIKMIELFRWNKTIKKMKKDILLNKAEDIVKVDSGKKVISVLFTRSHGITSELIYWVTGRQYTHSSIGLGEEHECYYSFDYRGFRIEHPSHRKVKNGKKESLCYDFVISEEDYRKLEDTKHSCIENQDKLGYNLIGAVFSVFHIYMPFKSKKLFFCSEFVSGQIREMESFRMKKTANMYLPTNLAKTLIKQKNLYHVFVNEI